MVDIKVTTNNKSAESICSEHAASPPLMPAPLMAATSKRLSVFAKWCQSARRPI